MCLCMCAKKICNIFIIPSALKLPFVHQLTNTTPCCCWLTLHYRTGILFGHAPRDHGTHSTHDHLAEHCDSKNSQLMNVKLNN